MDIFQQNDHPRLSRHPLEIAQQVFTRQAGKNLGLVAGSAVGQRR